ncbi:MAG: hypothetical protein EOO73_05340 [Myxococcales bacterium]|nr:MAG: hypothetical protein EOO73_05340 [Myxococcales bacterium]
MNREHVRGRLLVALLAGGLLSSRVVRAEETSGFTLETGSPDALCPALEVTREAVTRRLGSLVVDGRKGWRARYTIGHAPFGNPRDFVRLELFSPEGRVELVRDLPMEGESCRTMAEVIALVLDRYFRGLVADDQRPDEPAPSTPPEPAPQPSRPPAARPIAAADRTVWGSRLALEYAVSHPAALPWLGVRGSTAVGSRLELALGLRLALTPLQERARGGASVEARAAAARALVAWRLPLPLGLAHLGPVASVVMEQATTQGLATSNDRARALWSAGFESGYVAPVSRSLFVQTTISAEFLAGSGRLFIQNQEVLAPHWLTVSWSLGLGYY